MSRARDFADLAGSADAGGLTGRNLLINGDYKIWQRATSSTAANYSGPDRWYYGNAGTYSRSTDVPSGQGFQYSNSVKVTAATTYGVTAQRIEAANCKHLVGKSVTASFWLKTVSGSTSMNCILYRANTENGHSGGVTVIETKPFTGVTGTWTYYTLTWNNLPSETTNGLQLYFYSTDASTDPEYRITGVQLEVGEQATAFEYRSYGDELQRCQRYYEMTGAGAPAKANSSTEYWVGLKFQVAKRANPTASMVDPNTAIRIFEFGVGDRDSDSTPSISSAYYNLHGANVRVGTFSGISGGGTAITGGTTGDSSANQFAFDAEL